MASGKECDNCKEERRQQLHPDSAPLSHLLRKVAMDVWLAGKGFSSIWTELKQVGGFDGISCVTLIWVTPVSDGMLAKFVFL